MKTISILLAAALLSGCHTNPDINTKIVTQYKYIIVRVPDEMLQVGTSVDVPPENATDKEVANFLLDLYEKSGILDAQIRSIKDYQSKRIESVKKTIKSENIIEKE